jgi:predicted ester cyclase
MSKEMSESEVVYAFYDSYNKKDLDASFAAYISPSLTDHVMPYDRAGWLAGDKGLFPAFDDFTLTVLDQVGDGAKVATRYQLGGTHTGEFFGIPASGKVAYLNATAIDRVEEGVIVEHWADLDFTGFLQQLTTSSPSANAELKDLAAEYFRLSNAHDLDGLAALHAPGYVSHDAGGDTSVEEFIAALRAFFAAFPDTAVRPINVVAEGDLLVTHFETTGTHTGDFMGIAATGNRVRFTEIRVRRIENGKIVEHWGLFDQPTFLNQLEASVQGA